MRSSGPKSDPNKGGHMARHGPHIQLKLKLRQKRNEGRNWLFSVVYM